MVRTHRAGKIPRGMELRLSRRGPGVPLTLEGREPGPGLQHDPWALVGGGNARHIPPNTPILEGPSLLACLLLPHPPSYALRTYVAGGGPGRQGTRPGSQQVSWGREGKGNTCSTFPDPMIPEGPRPSASPPLPPSYLLPMPLGPTRLERAPEGRGPGPGAQQAS